MAQSSSYSLENCEILQGTQRKAPLSAGFFCYYRLSLDRHFSLMNNECMVEKIKYDLNNKGPIARLWIRWTDYFDLRIMTGKVFIDLFNLYHFVFKVVSKIISFILLSIYRSKPFQYIRSITPFAISDAFVLFGRYLYLFLLLFVLSFSSVFILLHFLQTSALLFFITLLPLIVFMSFSMAVIYFFIDKKEHKENLTLSQSFQACLQQFISISLLSLFHVFCTLTLLICFFMFGFFLGTFFDALSLDWKASFLYWLIVICFGIVILLLIFLFQIISYQAFFFTVLERNNPAQAFLVSKQSLKKHLFKFLLYYLTFSLCYIPFVYFSFISFSDAGVALLVLLYSQSVYFFSFLLRKQSTKNSTPLHKASPLPFTIFFCVGFISYILSAWFTIQIYPDLIKTFKQQYEEAIIVQNMTVYTNESAQYQIAYPKNWTIYKQESEEIILAGNTTRTDLGAVSVTISLYPIAESNFQDFYASKPGLLYYDQDTKDVITKVSNITIQGFDTVKYTDIENEEPFTSYQTHYLIKKQQTAYDIVFATRSKDGEKENEKLFEKMITSFRFTE